MTKLQLRETLYRVYELLVKHNPDYKSMSKPTGDISITRQMMGLVMLKNEHMFYL